MVTVSWNEPLAAPAVATSGIAGAASVSAGQGSQRGGVEPGATGAGGIEPDSIEPDSIEPDSIETGSSCADGADGALDRERQLEAWFRAHYTRLWRLLARLGVPRAMIDDVVQDAFVTASRRQLDIREGCEWAFLVGVAVRRSLKYRSRASARREVPHGDALDAAASPVPDAERLLAEKRARQQLEHALATLSDAHRAVFVLYELEGFSAPEIATLLELPLGTVASRLGRARAKFSETAARLQRAHRDRRDDP